MTTFKRSIMFVAALSIGLPGSLHAHGNPARWTAESTGFGCWMTRWLETSMGGTVAEPIVGLQVVLGRIAPPRSESAQPGLTQPELDGATTLNVRIVEPSLKDAVSVSVARPKQKLVRLEQRQLGGELGDFPSFYLTGARAESLVASLRSGEVSGFIVTRQAGSDVRFSNAVEGLGVAFAMYDACLGAKPRR